MFDRPEQLGAIWRDGAALDDAVAAAPRGATVAACPGWTAADLAWHVGEVHHFWCWVVDSRATEPSAYAAPDRPAEDDLVAWGRRQVDVLVQVLTAAEPTTPVWSWAPGETDVAWVTRRMAHETAVHRWDAEHAAGRGWAMPPALAADGLAELFAYFTGTPMAGAAPVGGTVHLHATDPELPDGAGEWLLDADETGPIRARPEHAKGDVALRGTAADLLLALWRRVPLDDRFTTFGDLAVAARLIARTDLG